MKKVIVTVPATTANLGPGFDTFGMAMSLYNQFSFSEIEHGLEIHTTGEGADLLLGDASNYLNQAAEFLYARAGKRPSGMRIEVHNNVPIASGMGSSSTAIVGGMVGANALIGSPFSQDEILQLATEMEGHPDNVAPALLGGFTVSFMIDGDVVTRKLPVPEMTLIVVKPEAELKTAEARNALPSHVSMADAVYNIGRASMVMLALQEGDYPLLSQAMDDRLHQPYRFPLIKGGEVAIQAGIEAGASCAVISGAGPSIIAFAPENHQQIGEAMLSGFAQENCPARLWLLSVDTVGTTVQWVDSLSPSKNLFH